MPFIEALGGSTCCGPDLGFGPDDDAALREATRFVAVEGMAPATARGVELALRAAVPEPRRVAVQGLGTVGGPLARSLGEQDRIEERLAAIGPLTERVLAQAAAEHRPPVLVAAELAEQALRERRDR